MRLTGKKGLFAAYVGVVIASVLAGPWMAEMVQFDLRPSNEPDVHRAVLLAMALFVLASALPFVPGAEIGLALLVMLGAGIAPLVYGAMVAALLLAFAVGRLVPARMTAAGFDALGMKRAASLMRRMQTLDAAKRLQLLSDAAPRRWVPYLLRHRYLLLGLALNLPGNTLAGGGGGLALAAGLSGLYSVAGYFTTVAIAVLPVPLVFVISSVAP